MASKIGFRLYPVCVKVYSTRGGTSGYTFRVSNPLSSIDRKFAVNTFWDIFPTDFLISPNRFVPSNKSRIINTFQRSLISIKVVSTGQAGKFFSIKIPVYPQSFLFRNYGTKLCVLYDFSLRIYYNLAIGKKQDIKQKQMLWLMKHSTETIFNSEFLLCQNRQLKHIHSPFFSAL